LRRHSIQKRNRKWTSKKFAVESKKSGSFPSSAHRSQREAHIAAEAVSRGGIPIVEITMTCPGAIEVIRELTKSAEREILIAPEPSSTSKMPAAASMPARNFGQPPVLTAPLWNSQFVKTS